MHRNLNRRSFRQKSVCVGMLVRAAKFELANMYR